MDEKYTELKKYVESNSDEELLAAIWFEPDSVAFHHGELTLHLINDIEPLETTVYVGDMKKVENINIVKSKALTQFKRTLGLLPDRIF